MKLVPVLKVDMDSDVVFHTKSQKVKKSVGDEVVLQVSGCFIMEGKIEHLICDMVSLKSAKSSIVIPKENITGIGIQEE